MSVLVLMAGGAAVVWSDEPTPQEVAKLVKQLSSDDFEAREKAVPDLIATGMPAVAAVEQAALTGESEARFRAVTVLAAWARGDDEALSVRAQKALRKVAAGDDAASARQADEALKYFTRLALMRRLAEAFVISTTDKKMATARLPLREKYLHRFVDLDRLNLDGTLWAVGKSGRPQAVMEVFPIGLGDGTERWSTAVASLTSDTLIAEKVDGVEGNNWSPEGWGEEFHPFPSGSKPAENAEQRQGQAAALARRFSAHQFWRPGETRYELAVRPEPVLRYRDEDAGILDGYLVVIVHDTNPEVLLLIEAQTEKGMPRWKYALAPMGSARMHVGLDQEEVWTRPSPQNLVGGGTHPYWVFGRITPPDAK
jgi:hypothetical protein